MDLIEKEDKWEMREKEKQRKERKERGKIVSDQPFVLTHSLSLLFLRFLFPSVVWVPSCPKERRPRIQQTHLFPSLLDKNRLNYVA